MKLSKSIRVSLDIGSHLLVTGALSWWVYALTREPRYVWVIIAGGVFVDLDHCIDYFLHYKCVLNARDFFTCRYLQSGKIYILLHSWELVIILGAFSTIFDSFFLLLGTFSFAVHLLIDNLQRKSPLFYFLLYRRAKAFSARTLYGGEHYLE